MGFETYVYCCVVLCLLTANNSLTITDIFKVLSLISHNYYNAMLPIYKNAAYLYRIRGAIYIITYLYLPSLSYSLIYVFTKPLLKNGPLGFLIVYCL